jgi:undecaprenyl-diphosphatase
MLDLLHQLSGFLEAALAGVSDNLWLAILFIFLVCVGEAIFVAGILVPSMPILILTGGLIQQGALPFWPIFIAASLGAVIGDLISYAIGWALKDKVKTVWPFKHHLGLIARGEIFFYRHGGKAIVIGRFITGIKAVIPGVAGMLSMPYPRFFVINLFSSFLWAAVHILPGMLLTDWLDSMGLSLEMLIIVGTGVLIVVAILLHYWRPILRGVVWPFGAKGKRLADRLRKLPPEPTLEEAEAVGRLAKQGRQD